MTQICVLIGSPGAKVLLSFARRRHFIAQRRRGPAGEPILPDPAFHWFPAWFCQSQRGCGRGQHGQKTCRGGKRALASDLLAWTPSSSPPPRDIRHLQRLGSSLFQTSSQPPGGRPETLKATPHPTSHHRPPKPRKENEPELSAGLLDLGLPGSASSALLE